MQTGEGVKGGEGVKSEEGVLGKTGVQITMHTVSVIIRLLHIVVSVIESDTNTRYLFFPAFGVCYTS